MKVEGLKGSIYQRGGVCWVKYHQYGRAVRESSRSTDKSTKAERIPHDFRRSSARNLIRAGIHQTVAGQLTGHRGESIFTRYNITAESDLIDATERLDRFQRDEAAPLPSGHNLGTIAPLAEDARRQVSEFTHAGVVKLADTRDLKSLGG